MSPWPSRIGAGLSTHADAARGSDRGGARRPPRAWAATAPTSRSSSPPGAHLAAPEATLEGVDEALAPAALVGCGAGGVLAARPRGRGGHGGGGLGRLARRRHASRPFHASAEETTTAWSSCTACPTWTARAGGRPAPRPLHLPHRGASWPTLGEPRTRASRCSAAWRARAPPRARRRCSWTASVVDGGAVGVRLDGVEVLPVRLAGRRAGRARADDHRGRGQRDRTSSPGARRWTTLREVIEALDRATSARSWRGGLLLGHRHRRRQARLRAAATSSCAALLGADPDDGDDRGRRRRSRPGQVVRLHARDAGSADRDLREALACACEALGGARPAGALAFTCNGRGRGDVRRAPTTTPAPLADALGGAPGRGLLRGGRDRAGRRRELPARLHRHRGGVPRVNLAGPDACCSPAPPAGSATRSPGRCAARGAQLVLDRAPRRRARAAGRRARRRAASPPTSPTAPPWTRWPPRRATVDILVANAGAARPASRSLEFTRRADRPRARRQPARARSCWRGRCRPAWSTRGSGHIVFISSLSGKSATPGTALYCGHEVRAARLRAQACARTCATRASASRASSPASSATPGMFADAGVELPPGSGTTRPEDVAAARREGDRAQPRPRSTSAPLFDALRRRRSPALAPRPGGRRSAPGRRGGDRRAVARGQAAKR